MAHAIPVSMLLGALSITINAGEPASTSSVTMGSKQVASGSATMNIPLEFIAPNSSRSDPGSALVVLVWPSLDPTTEVKLGRATRLAHDESFMTILVRASDSISDPERQYKSYTSFNKELIPAGKLFGLDYMRSPAPTVRDVFTTGKGKETVFARCETEIASRTSTCVLCISQHGFVLDIGFPRRELPHWETINFKVRTLIESWTTTLP